MQVPGSVSRLLMPCQRAAGEAPASSLPASPGPGLRSCLCLFLIGSSPFSPRTSVLVLPEAQLMSPGHVPCPSPFSAGVKPPARLRSGAAASPDQESLLGIKELVFAIRHSRVRIWVLPNWLVGLEPYPFCAVVLSPVELDILLAITIWSWLWYKNARPRHGHCGQSHYSYHISSKVRSKTTGSLASQRLF